MMRIAVYPKVGPASGLRVWVGMFDAGVNPPDVSFRIGNSDAQATAVRPMTAVHDHGAQDQTGVFDIDVPPNANGGSFQVTAQAGGVRSNVIMMRPMPDRVPDDGWLRILLTSCYHRSEDPQGQASRAAQNLPGVERPDLTLMMGDQVYLDLPTLSNFPDDEAKLARRFEKDYRENWSGDRGLAGLLEAAPSVCSPDDHEYWNNFPHSSPIIQNSWEPESRARWKRAADRTFDAFQANWPGGRGTPVEIDIDPLSIIVLDQRSMRHEDRSMTLSPAALNQLNDWVQRTIDDEKYGVVVTGQSLLDAPVGRIKGKTADYMLANYDDYEPIVRALARLAEAGRPVLLLTGDVHWGRVTRIRHRPTKRTRFFEIVCSPAALVSTVGADQLKSIGAGLWGFISGNVDRWPRHAEAPEADEFFAPQVFGKLYETTTEHPQEGDQIAMLALRRAAGGIEAKITYYEVHETPARSHTVELGVLRHKV